MKSSARPQVRSELRLFHANPEVSRSLEQDADGLTFGELVVKRHSMLCWQYVHRNLPFLQRIQRLARHVKALGHSTREHNDFRAVLQQFLHIGNLNTGAVSRSRFAPIPIARAAGEKALRPCTALLRPRPRAGPTKHAGFAANDCCSPS